MSRKSLKRLSQQSLPNESGKTVLETDSLGVFSRNDSLGCSVGLLSLLNGRKRITQSPINTTVGKKKIVQYKTHIS